MLRNTDFICCEASLTGNFPRFLTFPLILKNCLFLASPFQSCILLLPSPIRYRNEKNVPKPQFSLSGRVMFLDPIRNFRDKKSFEIFPGILDKAGENNEEVFVCLEKW